MWRCRAVRDAAEQKQKQIKTLMMNGSPPQGAACCCTSSPPAAVSSSISSLTVFTRLAGETGQSSRHVTLQQENLCGPAGCRRGADTEPGHLHSSSDRFTVIQVEMTRRRFDFCSASSFLKRVTALQALQRETGPEGSRTQEPCSNRRFRPSWHHGHVSTSSLTSWGHRAVFRLQWAVFMYFLFTPPALLDRQAPLLSPSNPDCYC